MGVATGGGQFCPTCKRNTLVVSQSMYDHEWLYAYCVGQDPIEIRGGTQLNACGWSWSKEMGPFPDGAAARSERRLSA